MQPDLFAPITAPGPEGLRLVADLVAPDEERALAAAIDAVSLAPFRFHGWLGRRLTATFGWRYDFEGAGFGPAEPIPDWLLPLRARAAGFAGLAPDALAHALLTRYDPGAGIGWHRDRSVFEHVVGVSLGAPATLRLRRRRPAGGFARAGVALPPRSAYHLAGAARHDWEHSIAPMTATRWSITFRSLSGRP